MTDIETDVTEYCVVSFRDEEVFERKVAELLNRGWSLAGGIAISVDQSNSLWYAQALTRDAQHR